LSKFTVQFLTRDQCSLCDAARPLVEKATNRFGGGVVELDVDSSADLKAEYDTRVPVVLGPDGAVIAEGRIERRDLNRRLRRLR
jgi:hypothetical protein